MTKINKYLRPVFSLEGGLTLLIAGLFFALRYPFFDLPFERDEGEYAYAAMLLQQGLLPYEFTFLQKPPMIIYVYVLADWISPGVVGARLLQCLSYLITVFFVKKIIDQELEKPYGFFAAILFLSLLGLPILFPFAANTEMFMIAPMMAAIYYMRLPATGSTSWILLGVLCAITLLFKPIAFLLLLYFFIFFWIKNYRVSSSQTVKGTALFVATGLICTFLFLSPFLLKGLGGELWEQLVIFNQEYVVLSGDSFAFVAKILGGMLKEWWLLLFFFLLLLLFNPKGMWLYIGALFVALLSIFKGWYGHYYIMILPFLAILMVIALRSVFQAALQKISLKEPTQKILQWGLVLVVAFYFYRPALAFYGQDKNAVSRTMYSYDNPFVEAELMAAQVKKITTTSDLVYVAGSEPQLLYWAERISPTRFNIAYPLTYPTPSQAKYQEEFVRAVENNLPKAIVFVNRKYSWGPGHEQNKIATEYIIPLLKEKYQLQGGVHCLENHQATWTPLNTLSEASNLSMYLYTLR